MSSLLLEIEPVMPAHPTDLEQALRNISVPHDWIINYGIINAVEATLAARHDLLKSVQVEHHFVPGHYIRTLHMPRGTLWVSKHHNTWHPFTITKGCISLYQEVNGAEDTRMPPMIQAGDEGEHFTCLTEPGTRRMLFCYEDSIWTTIHPTKFMTVEEVEASIILPNTNPLLQSPV